MNSKPVLQRDFRCQASILTIAALILTSSVSYAAPPPVTSHASDIIVSVNVVPLISGSLGLFAHSAATSTRWQPNYNITTTFATAAASGGATVIGKPDVIFGTGLKLSSKILTASASGGPLHTSASASVGDLSLNLKLKGADLITLGGSNYTIISTSTANKSLRGVLTASGTSSIAGLKLNILGQTIDLSAYANAAPNTIVPISGIAGLIVTINKQTVGQAAHMINILTDAIDINFTNLHLTGLPLTNAVNGDIIVGESFAQVPEPAIWAELLIGMGVLGGLARGRRRARPAV